MKEDCEWNEEEDGSGCMLNAISYWKQLVRCMCVQNGTMTTSIVVALNSVCHTRKTELLLLPEICFFLIDYRLEDRYQRLGA